MTITAAASIDEVVSLMQAKHQRMRRRGDPRRHFHGTYLRTTRALRGALSSGRFLDPDWVETWAAVFAGFYLDALGPTPSEVWVSALGPGPLSPRQRVLLGMHAHITYDLPLALLEVMDDDDFRDPGVRSRRLRDHIAVDGLLAARIGPELRRVGVRVAPPPAAAARRLRSARADVWANAEALSRARAQSAAALDAGRQELARLTIRRSEVIASHGWPWTVALTRSGVRLTPESLRPLLAATGDPA
jgi:hypothetical protein